jgi:hypothetical protein
MSVTPVRTIRLSEEDRKILKELAEILQTSQSEAIRLSFRAAYIKVKKKKPLSLIRINYLLTAGDTLPAKNSGATRRRSKNPGVRLR